MSWYSKANPFTPLGRNIGQWLMQGVNGLSSDQQRTMTDDLRSLMGPMDDISAAVVEGAGYAAQARGGQLSLQQQEIITYLHTLNQSGGAEQQPQMENTGGLNEMA